MGGGGLAGRQTHGRLLAPHGCCVLGRLGAGLRSLPPGLGESLGRVLQDGLGEGVLELVLPLPAPSSGSGSGRGSAPPSALPIPLSASVSSDGMIHILLESPRASWGSTWRYW